MAIVNDAEKIHEQKKAIDITTTRAYLQKICAKLEEIRLQIINNPDDPNILTSLSDTLHGIFLSLVSDRTRWAHGTMQTYKIMMISDYPCFESIYIQILYTNFVLGMVLNLLEEHNTVKMIDDLYDRAKNVINFLSALEIHLGTIIQGTARKNMSDKTKRRHSV